MLRIVFEVIFMTIREMRTQLGDTQSELSARYNIPFRTIQNWESGIRKPPEQIHTGPASNTRKCRSC